MMPKRRCSQFRPIRTYEERFHAEKARTWSCPCPKGDAYVHGHVHGHVMSMPKRRCVKLVHGHVMASSPQPQKPIPLHTHARTYIPSAPKTHSRCVLCTEGPFPLTCAPKAHPVHVPSLRLLPTMGSCQGLASCIRLVRSRRSILLFGMMASPCLLRSCESTGM